ncbi:hypothetical protein Q7C36_015507 [Tachysurus vachellii]|uniref:Uncharacterized protein n=1 Tax=Tachysurus vachellii TaxID=175792 RepID=A0AA88MC54_TACVA|nr:hypothetical protein Q7C36_015507 [Tachysurus vachellii]
MRSYDAPRERKQEREKTDSQRGQSASWGSWTYSNTVIMSPGEKAGMSHEPCPQTVGIRGRASLTVLFDFGAARVDISQRHPASVLSHSSEWQGCHITEDWESDHRCSK